MNRSNSIGFQFLLAIACLSALPVAAGPADLKGVFISGQQGTTRFKATPANVEPGDQVTIQFTVANVGDQVAAISYVRLYLPNANDYQLGGLIEIPRLDPGEYRTRTVTRTIPGSHTVYLNSNVMFQGASPAGNVLIAMELDATGRVSEGASGEANNTQLVYDGTVDDLFVRPAAGIDLAAYDGTKDSNDVFFASAWRNSLSFDAENAVSFWGQIIRVKGAIRNFGRNDSGPYTVKLYLSEDPLIGDANDHLLLSLSSSGLPAGLADVLNISPVPPNLPDFLPISLPTTNPFPDRVEQFYVGMIVDLENQVLETNEANNSGRGAGYDFDPVPVTIRAPEPDIELTPRSTSVHTFSDIANDGTGGALEDALFTIRNVGAVPLTVSDIRIEGRDPDNINVAISDSEFSVVEVTSDIQNNLHPYATSPIRWEGEETWSVKVRFDPTKNGRAVSRLFVESDDPDEPVAWNWLVGEALPTSRIELTDDSVDQDEDDRLVRFPSVLVDGPGGAQSSSTVTIRNRGSGPLEIASLGLSGGDFSVESVESDVSGPVAYPLAGPVSVAPDGAEALVVSLSFDPLTLGQHDAALTISSDSAGQPSSTVSLTGIGQAPGDLEVTDPTAPVDDLSFSFESTHPDGPGGLESVSEIELRNLGEADLTFVVGGIALVGGGSEFGIEHIISDQRGLIDLSTETAALAGGGEEVWTVRLRFDPAEPGAHSAQLELSSDDPDEALTIVTMSGTALDEPDLRLFDSSGTQPLSRPLELAYGPNLNDGLAGRTATRSFVLRNVGNQPLVVAPDGIGFGAVSDGYSILSVVSSFDGAVDLASPDDADRTIAIDGGEDWTVEVEFDPDANSPFETDLSVTSNDPDAPVEIFSVSGEGTQPAILTVNEGVVEQNTPALRTVKIKWTDRYTAGNAMVDVFYDTDTDSSSGLVAIAENISEDDDADEFLWQPPESLAGQSIWFYVTARDGTVSDGKYAAQPMHIEAEDSFEVISPTTVTSGDYGFEYTYLGTTYTGVTTLDGIGENTVTVTTTLPDGTVVTHTFEVRWVPSLLDQSGVTYDTLNRVETVTNGNGITTTFHYDVLGRLVKTEATNGRVVTWDYDVLGRRTRMQDYTGTTFYDWDEMDRLTAIYYSLDDVKDNEDDLVLQYSEYDLAGRLKEMVYPSGEVVRYEYDDGGRKTEINLPDRNLSWRYVYDYTRGGALIRLEYPEGYSIEYSYDQSGLLAEIDLRRNGLSKVLMTYSLGQSGRLHETEWQQAGMVGSAEEFTYDSKGSLLSERYSVENGGGSNELLRKEYTYDNVGHRVRREEWNGGVLVADVVSSYGSEGKLLREYCNLTESVVRFQYNGSGDRISRQSAEGEEHYHYSEKSFLELIQSDSRSISFRFNGDDALVGTDEARVVPDVAVAPPRPVLKVDGLAGVMQSVYGGHVPLADFGSEGIVLRFYDRRATEFARYTVSEETLEVYRFDAFGNRILEEY